MKTYWPLATEQQQQAQAEKLEAAKAYLNERGIAAYAVNSSFKYSAQPKVLAH